MGFRHPLVGLFPFQHGYPARSGGSVTIDRPHAPIRVSHAELADGIDRVLVLNGSGAVRRQCRLRVGLVCKFGGTHLGEPDLDGSQPLLAQPLAMPVRAVTWVGHTRELHETLPLTIPISGQSHQLTGVTH